MTTCFDIDALASVETALRWDACEALPHLTTCSTCRERLELLESVGRALREEAQVMPGFTDRVLLALAGASELANGRRLGDWIPTLLNPILAGLTALFGIGLAAQAAPVESGSAVFGVSALAAVATLAWNGITKRRGRFAVPRP